MPLKPSQILDSMPETKRYFKRRLYFAPVDFESFMMPMKQCQLSDCNGVCCHDGVCLDEDEEHFIKAVVDAHPVYFKENLNLTSENAFEDATFLGSDCRKTRSRRFKYPPHVKIPKHFPKTTCVFRFPDGRCSLQSLAMEHGDHPWAYKPMSCWLHPISLERDDRTILWIPQMHNDHMRDEGYPGYTPFTGCGCETPGGEPAYRVLKMEIDTLSAIVGRDFGAEMHAYWEKHYGQRNGTAKTGRKLAKAK